MFALNPHIAICVSNVCHFDALINSVWAPSFHQPDVVSFCLSCGGGHVTESLTCMSAVLASTERGLEGVFTLFSSSLLSSELMPGQ